MIEFPWSQCFESFDKTWNMKFSFVTVKFWLLSALLSTTTAHKDYLRMAVEKAVEEAAEEIAEMVIIKGSDSEEELPSSETRNEPHSYPENHPTGDKNSESHSGEYIESDPNNDTFLENHPREEYPNLGIDLAQSGGTFGLRETPSVETNLKDDEVKIFDDDDFADVEDFDDLKPFFDWNKTFKDTKVDSWPTGKFSSSVEDFWGNESYFWDTDLPKKKKSLKINEEIVTAAPELFGVGPLFPWRRRENPAKENFSRYPRLALSENDYQTLPKPDLAFPRLTPPNFQKPKNLWGESSTNLAHRVRPPYGFRKRFHGNRKRSVPYEVENGGLPYTGRTFHIPMQVYVVLPSLITHEQFASEELTPEAIIEKEV